MNVDSVQVTGTMSAFTARSRILVSDAGLQFENLCLENLNNENEYFSALPGYF
jgi:hypothetical protein